MQHKHKNIKFGTMVDYFKRYQVGLTLNNLYPIISGKCACGCNKDLPKNMKKWYSDTCRENAYINFAIIKGDNSIIRNEVFKRDNGFCCKCGIYSQSWQADHINPVFMGGGACSLSNIQTLCIDCHKEKYAYSLSHHNPISSQDASIRDIRILYAENEALAK